MRKQFNLQDWLKDKSQKVETRNGRPAHYIGLDRAGWQVFEIFSSNGTSEYKTYHDSYLYSGPGESTYDLFIVTPEPTEFEKRLVKFYNDCNGLPQDKDGVYNRHDLDELLHNTAAELLALAEKEIAAGHEHEVYISEDIYYEQLKKQWEDGYNKGRAEALKDLPRWKKIGRGNNYSSETEFTINGRYLEMNDTLNDVYESPLSALEKLPIFKED